MFLEKNSRTLLQFGFGFFCFGLLCFVFFFVVVSLVVVLVFVVCCWFCLFVCLLFFGLGLFFVWLALFCFFKICQMLPVATGQSVSICLCFWASQNSIPFIAQTKRQRTTSTEDSL